MQGSSRGSGSTTSHTRTSGNARGGPVVTTCSAIARGVGPSTRRISRRPSSEGCDRSSGLNSLVGANRTRTQPPCEPLPSCPACLPAPPALSTNLSDRHVRHLSGSSGVAVGFVPAHRCYNHAETSWGRDAVDGASPSVLTSLFDAVAMVRPAPALGWCWLMRSRD